MKWKREKVVVTKEEKERSEIRWDDSHTAMRAAKQCCVTFGGWGAGFLAGGSFPLCPPWTLSLSWLKWVADVEACSNRRSFCFAVFHWMTGRRTESRVFSACYCWLIRYATNTNADVWRWRVSAVWLLIRQKITAVKKRLLHLHCLVQSVMFSSGA